jgi:hypothetical protein
MSLSTDVSNIQSDVGTLLGHVDTYISDGGSVKALVVYLFSQLRLSDEKVSRMMLLEGPKFLVAPPDQRAFTDYPTGANL